MVNLMDMPSSLFMYTAYLNILHQGGTKVPPSTKYVMSESPAIVNDTFHGKDVQLDGFSVMLTINDLKESDVNVIYTAQLSYGANQTVQYNASLKSRGR
jgi:hypothetical protein